MTMKPSIKHTFRLPADLARQLADHARAKRVTQVAIVEAALGSFLSPDGADRMESAFTRRLDRMSRQVDRVEWNLDLSNELVSLFIRSWLTSTPPLPAEAMKDAKASSSERWEHFVASLARRMEAGGRLSRELSRDVSAVPAD